MYPKLLSLSIAALFLTACAGSSPTAVSTDTAKPMDSHSSASKQTADNGINTLTVRSDLDGVIAEENTTVNGVLQNHSQVVASNYRFKLDGKTYRIGDKLDISAYPQGLTEKPLDAEVTVTETGKKPVNVRLDGKIKIYKQKYSVIAATQANNHSLTNNGSQPALVNKFSVDNLEGNPTPFAKLPANVSYHYKGQAFTGKSNDGILDYTVDFGNKRGNGLITGLSEFGDITLKEAPITNVDDPTFKGAGIVDAPAVSAKKDFGTYTLGFFGPKAEEIAGSVELTRPKNEALGKDEQDFNVVFGGKR